MNLYFVNIFDKRHRCRCCRRRPWWTACKEENIYQNVSAYAFFVHSTETVEHLTMKQRSSQTLLWEHYCDRRTLNVAAGFKHFPFSFHKKRNKPTDRPTNQQADTHQNEYSNSETDGGWTFIYLRNFNSFMYALALVFYGRNRVFKFETNNWCTVMCVCVCSTNVCWLNVKNPDELPLYPLFISVRPQFAPIFAEKG